MTEFGDWLQNNFIDLARLAIDCAILVIVMKFSRTLLRTLRASQEQLGALLRLSVSDGARLGTSTEPAAQSPMHTPAPEPSYTSEREPAFAPMAPAPTYNSGGILGPINSGNGGGNGGFHSAASREREQSLGGCVTSEPPGWSNADTSVAVVEAASPTQWVAAPMSSAPEASSGAVMQWLNSPMPKRTKKPGNPIRKAWRWLQSPAGS